MKTKALALVLSPEDLAHVRQCLDLLQEAQSLIDSAAQALCPVAGFGDEWSGLGEAHEAVKRAWQRVEARRCGVLQRVQRPVATP